jgi:hypothetical protein
VIRPVGIPSGSLDTDYDIGRGVMLSGGVIDSTTNWAAAYVQTESWPADAYYDIQVGHEIRSYGPDGNPADYVAYSYSSYYSIGKYNGGVWQQKTLSEALGFAASISTTITGSARSIITNIIPDSPYPTIETAPYIFAPTIITGRVYLLTAAFDPYTTTDPDDLPDLGAYYIEASMSYLPTGTDPYGTSTPTGHIIKPADLPPVYGLAVTATASDAAQNGAVSFSVSGLKPY